MIPIQFGDGETAEQTAAALRVCEKKKERSLEPRGRVISDFTAIIQVQLLQRPNNNNNNRVTEQIMCAGSSKLTI